ITVSDEARQYLLSEGTDPRFGARHLKRAIDRLLVYPLSNLIATRQVSGGDILYIDFDGSIGALSFSKDGHWATAGVMSRCAGGSAAPPDNPRQETVSETVAWFRARSTKR